MDPLWTGYARPQGPPFHPPAHRAWKTLPPTLPPSVSHSSHRPGYGDTSIELGMGTLLKSLDSDRARQRRLSREPGPGPGEKGRRRPGARGRGPRLPATARAAGQSEAAGVRPQAQGPEAEG